MWAWHQKGHISLMDAYFKAPVWLHSWIILIKIYLQGSEDWIWWLRGIAQITRLWSAWNFGIDNSGTEINV